MRPHLIHPVWVEADPLDTSTSTWDVTAREQVPSISRLPRVRIKAQVHWASQATVNMMSAGGLVKYDGVLNFRRTDLEVAGWVPADGDRIVSVDGAAVEIYVVGTGRHRGQYRHSSGVARTLLQVPFEDRAQRHD